MLPANPTLGAFVRTMRQRAASPPSDHPGRRRTSGLRREELAAAAGISVTWLTWIEQGRTLSASAMTLARLARALHLSRAERAHLFTLAAQRDPEPVVSGRTDVPDALLACLRGISGPAYLLDALCEARGWNAAAEALLTGWLDRPDAAGGHNLLRFLFQNPAARMLLADWPERSRRVVAEFRAEAAQLRADAAMRGLVDELSAASPAFRAAWAAQGVVEREGGARLFRHPVRGTVLLEQVVFAASGWPGLKLVMLLPAQTRLQPPL